MAFNESRILFIFLLASLASSGCKKKEAAATPPPVVLFTVANPTNVPLIKEWIGTIEGFVNAQIRAQVSGYLVKQDYQEGSPVKKGDLLFEIDERPFQAALSQAEAKLAQDKAQQSRTQWDVERYAPLAQKNAISQQEYNDAAQANLAAKAQVQADEAVIEAARVNLSFTKITSPIDGLAGTAQAQIGDLVGPNTNPLTTVSTIDPVKVYFTTSEQAYLAYRRQYTRDTERAAHEQELELQLILADGSIYPHAGKFSFAGREVNPTTGTIQLIGLFPNPEGTLRPGQFARVRAQTQMRQGALLVPQRAVSQLQSHYQIVVLDDQNRAHIRAVTVGDRIGGDWLIEKGLNPGERVVVEGAQKAKEGALVNAQPFVPAHDSGPSAPAAPGRNGSAT